MNEVKLNDGEQSTVNVEFTAASDGLIVEDTETNEGKDRVPLTEAGESPGLPHDGSKPRTISEKIAQVSAT